MAKNSIDDLRDHLFMQLERLGNEDMTDDQLAREIERGKAINAASKALIDTVKAETDRVRLVSKIGASAGSNLLRSQEREALGIGNDKPQLKALK